MDSTTELSGISLAVSLVTFGGALTAALLGSYAWGQKNISGHREFALLCLAISLWCAFATLEYLSIEPGTRTLFAKATHLGSNFTPLFWLLFTLEFTQQKWKLRSKLIALLFVAPALNILLLATNPFHGLVWRSTDVTLVDGILRLNIAHGPWFSFVFMPIVYTYWTAGALLLMAALAKSESREFRHQMLWLLATASFIFFFNILYLVAGIEIYGMDPTPVIMMLASILIYFSISTNRFLRGPEISYRSVFMDAIEPVILIDNQGKIIDLNPAARVYSKIESSYNADFFAAFPDCPRSIVDAQSKLTVEEVPHSDGKGCDEFRCVELRSTIGSVIGKQIVIRDVSEHRKQTRQLQDLANRDPLTSLWNRRGFFRELDNRVRKEEYFTLIFVDLNDFKRINDHYGHGAGDTILIHTGQRLEQAVAGQGFAGRIGGDEFALILLRGSREQGLRMCNRLESIINQAIETDTGPISVSASIGIACFPEDGRDGAELMGNADKRMYWIKRQRLKKV